MAKKKQDLTPEERLAAALVPEKEQPYELPEGWKWVRLNGLADIIMGQSPRGFDTTDDSSYTPLIGGAADMGAKELTPHKYTKAVTKLSRKNDLVLCIRATLGRPVVSDGEYCLGRGVAGIRTIAGTVDWIRYYLIQSEPYLYEHATGSTFLQVTGKVLSDMPVPYPSVSEQQRLVARIESLFAKLDAAKDKVQSVLDSHETRKAALLHDAFTGKLTAKWREEHKFSYNEWHLVCIKDICHSLKYGTAKKSEASGRYVVIRMGNLFDGEILWDNLAYSNDNEDIEKYQLTPGDVLFNRTNSAALVGKTSIYRGDYPAIYAGYIIKLDYDRKTIDGEFLNYIMNSPCAKTYCNKVKTDGVNQSNINAKKIGAFQFKLPSLPEQQEIVRILGRLLAREQRARQAAEETLAAIDRMKQAILARAFRGEL